MEKVNGNSDKAITGSRDEEEDDREALEWHRQFGESLKLARARKEEEEATKGDDDQPAKRQISPDAAAKEVSSSSSEGVEISRIDKQLSENDNSFGERTGNDDDEVFEGQPKFHPICRELFSL